MALNPPNDLEQASDLTRGDLAGIYDKYVQRLYKYSRAILKNESWAEEATQNVFFLMVKNMGPFLRAKNLENYLLACVRNESLALREKSGFSMERTPLEEASFKNNFESQLEESETVERMLDSLPLEQREVLTLKCIHDLTFSRIAEIMKESPKTIASRYRLAMEKLRRNFNV